MTFKEFMLDSMGYEVKTTFWEDFSIADRFGISAIKDTYKRAFEEWKDNTEYITELVLVLNHKIWDWDGKDEDKAYIYNDLWLKADQWCRENLKGEDAEYYYRVTD